MLLYTRDTMKTNRFTYIRLSMPALLLLLLAGCNTTNRLHDYDFDDARVAVVANIPPRPVVFTDVLYEGRIDPDDPIGSIFRVGTALIKHNEAREAQQRMDRALDEMRTVILEPGFAKHAEGSCLIKFGDLCEEFLGAAFIESGQGQDNIVLDGVVTRCQQLAENIDINPLPF